MTFRPKLGLALLGVLAATTAAQAQSYPNRADQHRRAVSRRAD